MAPSRLQILPPFADPLAAFGQTEYIAVIGQFRGFTPMVRTASKRRQQRKPPLGLAEEERPFVHDEIVRGIAAKRVKDLIDRGVLDAKQVYRVIPERTFGRRLANRESLKPSEADAIGRLLRVTKTAESMLGDAEFAHKWLSLPNPALKNRIPIELAETDAGAREVEIILTRIAHGVYS
jgi:putative toxin-antitoxin system antitoxin component (TIGR02293 family)